MSIGRSLIKSIIDSTHSRVLVGACSGRTFFDNKHGESLSKAWERVALAFNGALEAIPWGVQWSVSQVSK